ncbi:MAG TPA: MFS transporter [Gemmatimonadaceae bacterium]|nr:MFS transporter [Gemmatimonadaceae bacterium]
MTAAPSAASPPARSLRAKLAIIAALYFAQGFPYGVFSELVPTFLRFRGVGLAEIGFLTAIGVPWSIKFLWAPLVDRLGTRKRWILAMQLLLAADFAVLALSDVAAVGGGGRALLFVGGVLLALTVLSATQDIAIDAYAIELLEEREYGVGNGVKTTAYRLALITSSGLLVALAAVVPWSGVFAAAAVLMALLVVVTATVPSPPVERARSRSWGEEMRIAVVDPFRAFLAIPGAVPVLVFVLAFKAGDFALLPMSRPFWIDAGFGPGDIGVAVGTVGVVANIAGALLGGGLTTRLGIFRALWMLGLAQAASNLAYYGAALAAPSHPLLYGVVVVEQFTGGLGTAAFLACLMALCERRYAATQYALLSALFDVGRRLVFAQSGVAAEQLGYPTYFLLTFVLAFPAFVLLPWVRRALAAREARTVTAAAAG